MKEQYDAIVVGAGIGGSIAGAYLAKSGLKTIVFEKTPWIGGRKYGSYKLGDISADKTCHIPLTAFTQNGGSGWWIKAAIEVGADIQWQALPNTQICFNGHFITMPYCTSGRAFANFITGLMPLPEKDKKELARVFDIAVGMPEEERYSRAMDEMPFRTWLDEKTDSVLVKELFKILNDISIVGGHDEASVTCTLGIMMAFLAGWANCCYMTDGTSDQLPKAFCRVTTDHGGQVLLKNAATKVVIKNGQAKGVVVKDFEGTEKTYKAKYVLINACYDVLDEMLGLGGDMPQEITAACQSMSRANEVIVEVHFALKKKIAHPVASQIIAVDKTMAYQGSILYPDHWVPSLSPPGKQIIQIERFLSPEEFKGRSLEGWTDHLRDVCEGVFPGLKNAIELEQTHVVSSPGGYYGFYYGPKVPVECPGISNLYFVGDYTAAPGMVTERAASSAMIATKKIIGERK